MLEARSGAEYTSGVVFELAAFGAYSSEILVDGVVVPPLANLESTESSQISTGEAGGTLHVRVGPGDRRVQIARSSSTYPDVKPLR